jgi:hypothetical protein
MQNTRYSYTGMPDKNGGCRIYIGKAKVFEHEEKNIDDY